MARVFAPNTPDEIEATGTKLFEKHAKEGENSPLKSLTDFNFQTLGDKDFAEWLTLHKLAKDLDAQAKQARERRDMIWKTKLKDAFLRVKNLIIGIAAGNPTLAIDWGFPTTKTPKAAKKNAAAPTTPTDGNNGGAGDTTPPSTN